MKRYKVTLEAEERQHLHDLIAAGKAAAKQAGPCPHPAQGRRRRRRPRLARLADRRRPGGQHRHRSSGSASGSSSRASRPPWTASSGSGRPGRSSSTAGPKPGSSPWPAPTRPRDGRVGRMQLLADKLVELEIVDTVSDETVRLDAQKNELKP